MWIKDFGNPSRALFLAEVAGGEGNISCIKIFICNNSCS